MDVQTLLIGIAVFIVSALLIWLITSLTVRERPFEERFEQQRQIERELLLLDSRRGAHSPGSKKDKTKKKHNKKVKVAGEQDVNGSPSSDDKSDSGSKQKTSKILELEIDPTIIETALDEPPVIVGKLKSSKPTTPVAVVAAKPILTNKGEKSAVRKSEEAPKLFHHSVVPKDALELKHQHDKHKPTSNQTVDKSEGEERGPIGQSVPDSLKTEKGKDGSEIAGAEINKSSPVVNGTSGGGKAKKQRQREPVLLQDEVPAEVIAAHIPQVSAAAPSVSSVDQRPRKNKATESASITETSNTISLDVLLESLQKINNEEVKQVIDVLTRRKLLPAESASWSQNAEWKNPKDQVNALAKQLEDKRKEVETEKARAAVATDKMNEMHLELTDLRQKMNALAKQSNDQLASQRQENTALTGHIKQLEAAAVNMRTQFDAAKAQLAANHTELQRITNENLHLVAKTQQFTGSEAALEEMRQKVKIMDDALKSNAVSYNASENAKKTLESKVKHLEEQVSFLENSLRESQMLTHRYSEAPEELRKAELRNKNLAMDLDHLTLAVQRLEKELVVKQEDVKISENKFHDISRQKSEVEGRLRLADTQAAELANSIKLKDSEIQALKSQLTEVLVEMKAIKDRPAADNVLGRQPDTVVAEPVVVLSNVQLTSAVAPSSQENALEGGVSVIQAELEKLQKELESRVSVYEQLSAESKVLLHEKIILEESKKESDRQNVSLTEKLATVEEENNKLKSTLDEKQRDLISLESKLHLLETELYGVQNSLQQKEIELGNAVNGLQQRESAIIEAPLATEQKDSAVAELESRLREKEAEYASTEERLRQSESTRANLESVLQQKEAAVADVEDRLRRMEADFSNASDRVRLRESEFQALEVELTSAKALVQQRELEVEDIKSRLLQNEEDKSVLESQLRLKESELAATASEISQNKSGHSEAAHQIEVLTSQLSSISEERNKLSESLEHVKKASDADWSLISTTLQRIFPDLHISHVNLKQQEWLARFELDVQQRMNNVNEADLADLQSRLKSSVDAEQHLFKQVQHYKSVLSDTEAILKRLQDTVESEEQKNLQKLQLLEMQLQEAKDELLRVQEEMKGMHKISECFNFIGAASPSVDHAECLLRKELSPEKKRRSLSELTEESAVV